MEVKGKGVSARLAGNGLAQFMLGAISTNNRDSSTGVMWTPVRTVPWAPFFGRRFVQTGERSIFRTVRVSGKPTTMPEDLGFY
jgi:hypothetical protein